MLQIAFPETELSDIVAKVELGERLSVDDGVRLYESTDLMTVGMLADRVNRAKNGNRGYFNQNRHINYTNICDAHCSFCGFRRDEGEDGAYLMSVDERLKAAATCGPDVTEFHIVARNHPVQQFSDYTGTMRALPRE